MDGQPVPPPDLLPQDALRARLAQAGDARLARVVARLADHLAATLRETDATPADLRAAIAFLTEVGWATSDQRQEWVLLADVLGLTQLAEQAAGPQGATPHTLSGPFYRADAPLMPDGASICRDGQGVPLTLHLFVRDLTGAPVPGAMVDIWHANGQGHYENQVPDLQPDMNLRGRFLSGPSGQITLRTVRPGGYAIPGDGPVGALMARLGLPARRPAHVHARVTTTRFHPLTTHLFDAADPAIDADPLFAVHPDLRVSLVPDGAGGWQGAFTFILASLT